MSAQTKAIAVAVAGEGAGASSVFSGSSSSPLGGGGGGSGAAWLAARPPPLRLLDQGSPTRFPFLFLRWRRRCGVGGGSSTAAASKQQVPARFSFRAFFCLERALGSLGPLAAAELRLLLSHSFQLVQHLRRRR